MRLNVHSQTGEQSEEGQLVFEGNTHWYFPDDDSVDLAVLPFAPGQKYDYQSIPYDRLATKEVIAAKNIAEGDPVLFAGFFDQYPGQKKIELIVRQGILAMMPDEELTTTRGKPGRIYLADVHVFGGNSGTPMLVTPNVFGDSWILGIVSGYFYETEDFKLEIATTLKGKADANSGISMVVPADQLKAFLDSASLAAQRNEDLGTRRK